MSEKINKLSKLAVLNQYKIIRESKTKNTLSKLAVSALKKPHHIAKKIRKKYTQKKGREIRALKLL